MHETHCRINKCREVLLAIMRSAYTLASTKYCVTRRRWAKRWKHGDAFLHTNAHMHPFEPNATQTWKFIWLQGYGSIFVSFWSVMFRKRTKTNLHTKKRWCTIWHSTVPGLLLIRMQCAFTLHFNTNAISVVTFMLFTFHFTSCLQW